MKTNLLSFLTLFLLGTYSYGAYSANDFIFPKMHNKITLKSKTGSSLKVKHTYVYDTFGKRFHSMRFQSASSLAINDYKRSVAFLFDLQGSKVKLKNYELESYSYLVTRKDADNKTWFSIPEEAWSTTEHKFLKPTSAYTTQTAKSSFKKVKARNGKEYYSLIVKVSKNGVLAYTLVFARDIGLLQYITKSGVVYENDLWFENLANKFKANYTSETAMRKASWKYYKRVTAYTKDTAKKEVYNSPRNRLIKRGIDTLAAFYLGLSYKSSSLTSFGKYLASSRIEKYINTYHTAILKNRDKSLNKEMGSYAEWALFLMPTYSKYTADALKKHVTHIDDNYKPNYMSILDKNIEYLGNKSDYSGLSLYEANKMLALGKVFMKETGTSSSTKENVYNYIAFAHQKLGNKNMDLYYNSLAAEEFAKFSDESKAENIGYAKSSIQDLLKKSTTDESIHIRSINALLSLKAKSEALEKAQKGYNQGFESKKFGFTYADIALPTGKENGFAKGN